MNGAIMWLSTLSCDYKETTKSGWLNLRRQERNGDKAAETLLNMDQSSSKVTSILGYLVLNETFRLHSRHSNGVDTFGIGYLLQ